MVVLKCHLSEVAVAEILKPLNQESFSRSNSNEEWITFVKVLF